MDLGWPLMLDRSMCRVYVLCIELLDSSDCSCTTNFFSQRIAFITRLVCYKSMPPTPIIKVVIRVSEFFHLSGVGL